MKTGALLSSTDWRAIKVIVVTITGDKFKDGKEKENKRASLHNVFAFACELFDLNFITHQDLIDI